MTGPLINGDPIDPNEQLTYAPVPYPTYAYVPADSTTAAYGGAPADRPNEVVLAAVLSLITAGLLLITGFVVIFAASALGSGLDSDTNQRTTLFVLAGLMNVVAAALLIIGGVLLLGRSASARSAIAIGTLLCMVLGVFWLANDNGDNGVVIWLIIFCGPVVTATILSTTSRVTAWLQAPQ